MGKTFFGQIQGFGRGEAEGVETERQEGRLGIGLATDTKDAEVWLLDDRRTLSMTSGIFAEIISVFVEDVTVNDVSEFAWKN
jgi:hypothetical protein